MSGFFYYMLTFAESLASVVGLRFPYDQPPYTVLQHLGDSVEIRKYDQREAIQATIDSPDKAQAARQAFGLLFNYITGDNHTQQKIAMTVPVQTQGEKIAMTAPVQISQADGALTMMFFLPKSVAQAGAPAPNDPHLHLVEIPPQTIAAIRYSGIPTATSRDHEAAELLGILARSSWQPTGTPYQMSYDPPFTIPFLRRNEVAVTVTRSPRPSP
jgi:hypothetical protein